jgi:hypothetical protein
MVPFFFDLRESVMAWGPERNDCLADHSTHFAARENRRKYLSQNRAKSAGDGGCVRRRLRICRRAIGAADVAGCAMGQTMIGQWQAHGVVGNLQRRKLHGRWQKREGCQIFARKHTAPGSVRLFEATMHIL